MFHLGLMLIQIGLWKNWMKKYSDDSGCDYYLYDGVTDEERKWLEDKLSELMNEFHQKIGITPGWFKVITMDEVNLNDYKEVQQ